MPQCPVPGNAPLSPLRAEEVSIITVVWRKSACCSSHSTRANPSRPGICASTRINANGLAESSDWRNRSMAPVPLDASTGRIPQRSRSVPRMRRLVALSSTTRARRSGQPDLFDRRASTRPEASPTAAVKWKQLPSPGLALDPDAAAHHTGQPRGDRQAQPRAAEPARHGAIGLGEGLEDGRLLFRRDADAGVADGEVQDGLLRSAATPARPLPPPRLFSVNLMALPTRLTTI